MTPEKETPTRKFVGLDEKGYETSEPTQYVEVLEEETPTLKGVEEEVAEWDELIKVATKFELRTWLRTTLLARDAAHEAELSQERTGFLNKIAEIDKEHEARLREVFKKIINCGSPDRWGVNLVYESEIKEIAAHHGITNL